MHGVLPLLVRAALLVLPWRLVARQCRKPAGWLGTLVLKDMNRRHAELTSWGLAHAAVEPAHTILDVGCGGGRTLQRLAAMAEQGRPGIARAQPGPGGGAISERLALAV